MLARRAAVFGLRRLATAEQSLEPIFTEADSKRIKRIESQRKAVILEHQKAAVEGKILPMIHILEKIQEAVKSQEPTPMQKLETALNIQATDGFDLFLEKKRTFYGSFGLDLYGTEKDQRADALMAKGEVVPACVRNEDEMIEYRKYFAVNFNVPGTVENINPNKFLRLKS